MDEDKFALVERILKDIDNILSKNAELYAFDIVPVDINFKNKSPVLHLENCLGIESWCIKHVYMYCYTELMDKYLSKRSNSKLSSIYSERFVRLLNVTLLLNPELSTMWNKRRDLVLKCFVEKTSELQFTRLVLSRKPKCNDAFVYRRWLLEGILKDKTNLQSCIENLVTEELHICELASDKSPNNYHSWNNRMWVLNLLKIVPRVNLNSLYIEEYKFSERWASKHVSDYSCFHYRQFCIKNICQLQNDSWNIFQDSVETNLCENFIRLIAQNCPKNVKEITEDCLLRYTDEELLKLLLRSTANCCSCIKDNVAICRILEVYFYELVLNSELLRFYKYHETLWYHRRFIVHEIMSIMYDCFGLVRMGGAFTKKSCNKCNIDDIKQKPKIVRYDSSKIYSSLLFNVLFTHEINFIEERLNDSDKYADRHEKYLKFVEGWNIVM